MGSRKVEQGGFYNGINCVALKAMECGQLDISDSNDGNQLESPHKYKQSAKHYTDIINSVYNNFLLDTTVST